MLLVPNNYRDDLNFFRKRWTPGTCGWILSHPLFESWRNDEDSQSSMLWLYALPASGKSILSSFIIHTLDEDALCVHYFFRFGDQAKRSLSSCLRVLAFQIAEKVPQFRHALLGLKLPANGLEKMDARSIWDKVFGEMLFRMRFSTTQCWIIDALDEADYPRLLVDFMQDIAKSFTPIKVLLISRETPDLLWTFERLSMHVPTAYLPIDDTKRDIRNFLENEVKHLRLTSEFQSQIVADLVEGAGGNFLWARLAFDEVRACNTQEDVDETLRRLPSGMEQFYERMEQTLSLTLDKERDKALGKLIMTWTVCSRQALTIEELRQVIQPEVSLVTDLRTTISRVCGQFIVVDSTDRLVMVHQTARDYIIGTESEFSVDEYAGHEQLFRRCLLVLESHPFERGDLSSSTEQRAGSDTTDLLVYAATSWPYHLERTSVESDQTILALSSFLRGRAVLFWIMHLARRKSLKILVSASRSLVLLAQRKRVHNQDRHPLRHLLDELQLIDLWAADLIKILGKFGEFLIADPTAVQDLVPAFCPKNSGIYNHFVQNNVKPYFISVAGFKWDSWDDSLARLTLRADVRARSVLCAANYIAVITSAGDVILYNATTFEVQRVLDREGPVEMMCFSPSSVHLATWGLRKSTKIWEVESGSLIHRIENPRSGRAFAMEFNGDGTQLVAGCEDGVVRVADLTAASPNWMIPKPELLKEEGAHNRSTPAKNPYGIALNVGATHVAVTYRNAPMTVWSLQGPQFVKKCLRSREKAADGWTLVEKVIWHSHGVEVLGIYQAGHVFRWNPFEDTQRETPVENAVYLASSPNGKFFAVGDHQGTIKLFDWKHFTLVYSLAYKVNMNKLCFSPDSKRVYDVRSQSCNVWEPSVLVRTDDSLDQESDTTSDIIASPATQCFSEVRDQVTAVAVQFRGAFHAFGNETGVISVLCTDALDEQKEAATIWRAPVELPVVHMAWSGDGNYLACAVAGKLAVLRFDVHSSPGWTAVETFARKPETSPDGIKQVLLNADGRYLFVQNGPTAIVWSLDRHDDTRNHRIDAPNTIWRQHPTSRELLIAFEPTIVSVYKWSDFSLIEKLDMAGAAYLVEGSKVNRIIAAPSLDRILLDVESTEDTLSRRNIVTFQMPWWDPDSPESSSDVVHIQDIPDDIKEQVEISLGTLPLLGFIFLNKSYWVCSYSLEQGLEENHVKRHYFLPKDWLNADSLRFCTLHSDGSLLIPNNGQLAVVRCTAMR